MAQPWLEVVGWVGAALVVWSLAQTHLLTLRVLNLVGALLLAVYNAAIGVWPMFALSIALGALNVWRIASSRRDRHDATAFEVLGIEADNDYLRHVLRVHEGDIRSYNPEFVHDPFRGDIAYLVLKGDETIGVVLMRDAGNRTAQLLLDYVTPRYRDVAPGEFIFGPDGPFRRRGFRRVVAPRGMVDPYYERLGFRRDGDAFVL